MKNKLLVILIILFITNIIYPANNIINIFNKMHQYDSYTPAIASSFLTIKNDSKTFNPVNICDKRKETSWAPALTNGINEFIYIHFNHPEKDPMYEYYFSKPMKIKLSIINGYAKNAQTFLEYNRVNNIYFEVYEGAIAIGQDKVRLYVDPILNTKFKLKLKDSSALQSFYIELNPKLYNIYRNKIGPCFSFIGKLIINDIYKGTKYPYTCISEINAVEIND
jgi:hypothetical protein